MLRRWKRRALTVPAMFLGCALALLGWPLWVLLALISDVALGRWRRLAATRVALLLPVSLTIECVGLTLLFLVFVTTLGSPTRRATATWHVQQAYTRAHLFAVARAFALRFEVEGDALVKPGPLLVFIRHASLLDVLLPGAFLAAKHGVRLRYVLKRELLIEPCLDIAGHWLPNHFVARDGAATAREIEAIRALATDLKRSDGVLLYPEGTFFSPTKRERAITSAQDDAARDHARSLQHLLPCRLGGATTVLEAASNTDVLFVGHAGFEGLRTAREIARGDIVGRTIRLRYWRILASDVPREPTEQVRWLRGQWSTIDQWVGEHAPVNR